MTTKIGKKRRSAIILLFNLSAFPLVEHLESHNYSIVIKATEPLKSEPVV